MIGTDNMQNKNERFIDLKRVFGVVLAVYVLLALAFYFLAGDQLRYRNTRGAITAPAAEAAAAELTQDIIVEQRFSARIQRLETVSVQWGTSYRTNAGTVTMELWNEGTGELLLSQTFDASAIPEGGFTTLSAETPLEELYSVPLLLRLTSDSQRGSAVSPLVSLSTNPDGFSLSVNGKPAEGQLCLSSDGQDYIWTGLNYWKFVTAGFVALVVLCALVFRKQEKGHSYMVNAIYAVRKYNFLIRQLVSRDFKTKYKRSVLGVFWSFLNPLLMMLVQYFVFSTIFRSDIKNFPAYLIIGTVTFNFFSEACGMSLTSVIGNAGLITKVYMPKYIYPLTRTMSSGINLLISIIPMLIVCLVTGVHFQKSAVLALFFFLMVFVFSLGLGMLLSASMVFFRDTQFLWNVLNMIWMYATPLFYPETIIPEKFSIVLNVNPLYHFIKNIRICILDGISPEPVAYVRCFLIALAMLLVGAGVFKKAQDSFVLYL